MVALTDSQRDMAARYFPLAKAIAGQYARFRPRLRSEIFSAAQWGLVLSAIGWRPDGEATFATYAWSRIRHTIIYAVRREIPKGYRDEKKPPACPPKLVHFSDLSRGGVLDMPGSSPDPRIEFEEWEDAEVVLRKLPAKTALAVRMDCLYGLDRAEVARRMGCSTSEVDRQIRIARKLLGA